MVDLSRYLEAVRLTRSVPAGVLASLLIGVALSACGGGDATGERLFTKL